MFNLHFDKFVICRISGTLPVRWRFDIALPSERFSQSDASAVYQARTQMTARLCIVHARCNTSDERERSPQWGRQLRLIAR